MSIFLPLAGHLLGDFYLQTNKMAEEKGKSIPQMLLHILVYTVAMAAALFAGVQPAKVVVPLAVIAGSHLLVDCAMAWGQAKLQKNKKVFWMPFVLYIVDQALHIAVILAVWNSFSLGDVTGGLGAWAIPHWGESLIWNATVYLFLGLVILYPAAITVKKLLDCMPKQPKKLEDGVIAPGAGSNNAGQMIGMLERLIVAVLVLSNQYGAIAFVMAAKSLARFKQLEDQDFAEKYLVGTLASIAIALVFAVVCGQALK
ncbi:MAG: DUF3307 domain-containing protein [Oscillospiraceae bacterium]